MNYKSEINQLQKQMLERLNVKTGSTLYIIIQEVSRQAYAKSSFLVSQKNSTLAKKCNVTASTISRNLKKLKEKCSDLITIEQNRNIEEKFAALVFTFNCEKNSQLENQCQTEESNGGQSVYINTDNECIEVAEITSSNFSTESLVLSKSTNKDLIHNTVNNNVKQDNIIHEVYIEFKKQGVNKTIFQKVLAEVQNKQDIKDFRAYLTGALNNVINHISFKNGTRTYENPILQSFYDYIHGDNQEASSDVKPQISYLYDWMEN